MTKERIKEYIKKGYSIGKIVEIEKKEVSENSNPFEDLFKGFTK